MCRSSASSASVGLAAHAASIRRFNEGWPAAEAQVYLDLIDIILAAPEVDGLLLMSSIWRDFVIDVIKEVIKMCRHYDKPASIYTPNSISKIIAVRKQFNIPIFDSMEEAVRALVVSYEQFRYLRKKEQ